MTYQEFKNKWLGKGIDLFSTIFGSWKWSVSCLKCGILSVHRGVFGSICNNQIFNPIINLNSVKVVDYFGGEKFPAEMFLHNHSLLLDSSSPTNVNPIITATKSSPTFPVWMTFTLHVFHLAITRTVDKLSFFVAFIVSKLSTAIVTFKNPLSGLVVTLATTKPSFLRWRGFKSNSAHLTKIIHSNNYSIQCL